MHLAHLSLTNFRNFIRLDTDIPTGPLILVGANAQGKTSLLEAIYYLAGASSPHTASDRQLINFLALHADPPFTRLVGEVRRADRLQRIEIRVVLESGAPGEEPRLRKEVLLNGLKRRTRDLSGGFNAVLFLPQDLGVIEGAPGDRRRYLDNAVAQADPVYADALSEYGRVLTQRNALLRQLQERSNTARLANGNGSQVDFWDEQLCNLGAILIRGRALAISELDQLAGPIHARLSNGAENLHLSYRPSFDPLPRPEGQLGLPLETPLDRSAVPQTAIAKGMRAALRSARADEIARGMTLLGPHRDEFRLVADGVDLGTYGSRGQNRTAMLSLKLAEVDWVRACTGEWPALLLDEVLAELDVRRRAALLERVHAAEQAILTSADLAMFPDDFRAAATLWRIESGTVRTEPAVH